MPSLVTRLREFRLTSITDRLPAWTVDRREVARVFDAPLASFLPGAPIVTFERTVREWRIRYGAYQLDGVGGTAEGLAVWGATARILGQLGAILGGD